MAERSARFTVQIDHWVVRSERKGRLLRGGGRARRTWNRLTACSLIIEKRRTKVRSSRLNLKRNERSLRKQFFSKCDSQSVAHLLELRIDRSLSARWDRCSWTRWVERATISPFSNPRGSDAFASVESILPADENSRSTREVNDIDCSPPGFDRPVGDCWRHAERSGDELASDFHGLRRVFGDRRAADQTKVLPSISVLLRAMDMRLASHFRDSGEWKRRLPGEQGECCHSNHNEFDACSTIVSVPGRFSQSCASKTRTWKSLSTTPRKHPLVFQQWHVRHSILLVQEVFIEEENQWEMNEEDGELPFSASLVH